MGQEWGNFLANPKVVQSEWYFIGSRLKGETPPTGRVGEVICRDQFYKSLFDLK